MGFRLVVAAVLLLAAAACDRGGSDPAPAEDAASPKPPVEPAAEPAETGPAVPDARAVDPAQFLRPGTGVEEAVYGEMNGVPPEEIAIHSRALAPEPDELVPQEYLDVYSWDPGGQVWLKVFDATTFEHPPGGGGTILLIGDSVNQSIHEPPAMVDLAGDGTSELVFGVQSSGATAGPYEIRAMSWPSESFAVDFYFATERGGTLRVDADGRTLTLVAAEYRPGDPGCCPSYSARRTIGYDPASGKIGILKTERTPNPAP